MGLGRWFRRRSDDGVGAAGERLAAECEAFLDGRYSTLLRRQPYGGVPAWVWLNPLAHRSAEDLDRFAGDTQGAVHRPRLSWRECQTIIAAELFRHADGDVAEFQRIQREVLQPLECALAAYPGLTPDDLTWLALASMAEPVGHFEDSDS